MISSSARINVPEQVFVPRRRAILPAIRRRELLPASPARILDETNRRVASSARRQRWAERTENAGTLPEKCRSRARKTMVLLRSPLRRFVIAAVRENCSPSENRARRNRKRRRDRGESGQSFWSVGRPEKYLKPPGL